MLGLVVPLSYMRTLLLKEDSFHWRPSIRKSFPRIQQKSHYWIQLSICIIYFPYKYVKIKKKTQNEG